MELKIFEDIEPGWYSVMMDDKARVVYKFVTFEKLKNDGEYVHYLNIMYDEVLRIAQSHQLPEGLIFTPIEWQQQEDKSRFVLTFKKEMA